MVEGYIVDLVPQTAGSAKLYTINPPLPLGSKINKENGYIEITSGTENNNYTVTVSNDVNEMSFTFSVYPGSSAQEPVRFFKLGYYDQYEFVVGHPVDLPVFVTGPITICQMTGEIAGLTFNINGLKGTPTTAIPTIQELKFTCRNEVTVTNEVIIRAMVHSTDKPGLIANYWKWVRYTLAFPCNVRVNPFVTPGASLEVQKIATSITINSDNDFNFYPDFGSYYGVMYTGYIKIPASRSYVFSTQSATGSYIEIDDIVAVNHMTSCHNNEKATGSPLELTEGYHRITLGWSRKEVEAYARFFWKKDGVTEREIEMGDLSHIPMNSISYEMTINSYPKTDAGVKFLNNLLTYDVTIRSCRMPTSERLPNGMQLATNGSLHGTPTEITTFADHIYTVICETDKGELSHQFSVEVRDFNYLPAIPYIMLKRAVNRRVPVNPDMQFQLLWVIDHSCYPNRRDLYWKVTEAPDSTKPVTCTGQDRQIRCVMHIFDASSYGGAFDAGSEYDQAFQLPGTALSYYEKATYLLVTSINNDPKRSAVLKFSYTCLEVTPIPGWVYYGIWTVHNGGKGFNYMPEAPVEADGRCCGFELFDRNNIEILSMPKGYPDWLMRQGLLLEPNEYTLYLKSLNLGYEKCKYGAYFNLTMDNQYEVVYVPFATTKEIKIVVRRMECVGLVTDAENLPTTTVGGTVEFECPSKQFGKRIRQCRLDVGGAPFWAPMISTCRAYIPIKSFHYELQYVNLPINLKYKLIPIVEGDYDKFEFDSLPIGQSKYDTETGEIELLSSVTVREIQK